jgi:ribosomal protein S18 acetylase RimI-like enzyme
MEEVRVIKVTGSKQMNDFIQLPKKIYRNIPQYVPEFESDVRGLFDIKTNPGLEFSKIQPFVAYRGGEPVGRIVGIVNRKANKRWNLKNVRFSMIEFIDDYTVSRALIEAVEAWGTEFGMEKIHGPLGVTDFDKEGMLVEDFDLTGSMTAIYNPPYYPQHMELLGFEKEVDWQQIRIDIPEEVPAKYARVAQYARETIGLRVVKRSKKEIRGEYGQRAFRLFNQAYESIFGFSELSPKQVDNFLRKYVALIDTRMIPIIENDKGEIVGAAVTMGSLCEALKKSNGRLWPFGWYHLLKSLFLKREKGAEMLLIAIRPDYQGLGVNAMFFDDLIPLYNRLGIKWAETGPQLEDNVRELTQWKPLKPTFVKRRRCYVKTING